MSTVILSTYSAMYLEGLPFRCIDIHGSDLQDKNNYYDIRLDNLSCHL